jgi:hypothetical protein
MSGRTGILLRQPEDGRRLDIDSFEIAAARVAAAAESLRRAAALLKAAAEERDEVCRKHRAAIECFQDARRHYDIARQELSTVERGDVLPEVKALPLPPESP